MQQKPFILIIEDEPDLSAILEDYFHISGMAAETLPDGSKAVETILEKAPDVVVLDIMLPGKDGLTICREVREKSDVPIILQTAKVEEIDRLLGLELGADDYLCKPCSPRELVARVRAVLRRVKRQTGEEPETGKGLKLDSDRWIATYNGENLDLTRRELQLLYLLCRSPGRVYSRAQILEQAYPDDADVFDRTIDSHIKNIRNKVKAIDPEAVVIRSVYGVGYSCEG